MIEETIQYLKVAKLFRYSLKLPCTWRPLLGRHHALSYYWTPVPTSERLLELVERPPYI